MPHFECVGCRLRLHTDPGPPNAAGELCPVCDTLLEPVAGLQEIVGFQAFYRAADDEFTLPAVETVALPLPGTEL